MSKPKISVKQLVNELERQQPPQPPPCPCPRVSRPRHVPRRIAALPPRPRPQREEPFPFAHEPYTEYVSVQQLRGFDVDVRGLQEAFGSGYDLIMKESTRPKSAFSAYGLLLPAQPIAPNASTSTANVPPAMVDRPSNKRKFEQGSGDDDEAPDGPIRRRMRPASSAVDPAASTSASNVPPAMLNKPSSSRKVSQAPNDGEGSNGPAERGRTAPNDPARVLEAPKGWSIRAPPPPRRQEQVAVRSGFFYEDWFDDSEDGAARAGRMYRPRHTGFVLGLDGRPTYDQHGEIIWDPRTYWPLRSDSEVEELGEQPPPLIYWDELRGFIWRC
jgi:hypothetical protein